MRLTSWLSAVRSFGYRTRPQGQYQKRTVRHKLDSLERLEDRTLLAVNPVLSGGGTLLTVTLTLNNDHAYVRVNGADIDVANNATFSSPGGGNTSTTFVGAAATVTSIVVTESAARTGTTVTFLSGTFLLSSSLSSTGIETVEFNTAISAASVSVSGATGGITQAGVLTISGTTTLDGDAIALTLANDFQGNVSATGSTVQITDANDLPVGLITGTGAVTLTATAGALTDGNGGASNISAPSLSVSAATGIDLDTTIGTLTSANVTGTGAIDLSDTAGGLVVTSATTNLGTITLNATSGDLTLTAVTASTAGGVGNVVASTTTSGNILVNDVTAAGDNIQLTSVGTIDETGGDGTADLTSGTATLSAATGIGGSGTIEVNLTTLTSASVSGTGAIDLSDTAGGLVVTSATTADGAITLNATGGDLTLTTVTATGTTRNVAASTTTSGNILVNNVTAAGDNIQLTSVGAIDETGGDGTADLTSGTATLSAATGIGGSGTIEVSLTTLTSASVSGTGVIDLSDLAGGLVVTSATTNAGTITLNATGGDLTLTTVTASTAGGAGDVVASTTTSGNIVLDTVTAAGDGVRLAAAGGITDNNAGSNNVTASSLQLVAASGIGNGNAIETIVSNFAASNSTSNNIQIVNTGALTVTSVGPIGGATVTGVINSAAAGTISVQANSPLTINSVVSGPGDILLQAGNSGSLVIEDDLTINANITSTGGGTIDLIAGDDIIQTGGTITSTAGVGTRLVKLTADNEGVGTDTDRGGISQSAGNIVATNLVVRSFDTVDLSTVSSNNVTNLAAVVTKSGATFDYEDADSVDIQTVDGVNGISSNAGHITVDATTGTSTITVSQPITSTSGTGGAITITGSVTVGATITAAGGNVTLHGSTGPLSDLIINFPLNSSAPLVLSAQRDILVSALVQTTTAGSGISLTADFDNTGTGGVRINQLGQIISLGAVALSGSDLNAPNVPSVVSVVVVADGANVQIRADAAISMVSGSAAPAGADIVVDGVISELGTGTVTITANHDVTFAATGDITTAGGVVSVTADNAAGANGGVITQADGAVIDAGSATITLVADGSITLGSVVTTSASATAVTITSTNGGIVDGGDANVDIVANSGRSVLTARLGIGDGGALGAIETTIAELDASVTGPAAGNLSIVETNAIDLILVDTANGSITVSAGGTITATNVSSTTDADANDITLTTTSGDIVVGLVSAGVNAGDVTLTAAARIIELGTDGSADIVGDDLRLVAATGIGSLGKIEIDGLDLAATTATGGISLNDTSLGLTIASVTTNSITTVGVSVTGAGGGNIDISTSSPLIVNAPVSDAGGGDITLAANGSALADDLSLNANVTATGGTGKIFLYAGHSINVAATTIVSAASTGTVLLSAGTNYNNGGTLQDGNSTGKIAMLSGSIVQSQDGDITLLAPEAIDLSIVNADAAGGTATAGNVIVTADYGGPDASLYAANGSGAITDILVAETANITGNQATLSAATGIGLAATLADDIDTTIVTLVATNSTTGDIVIRETDTLIVGGTGVRTLGGDGNINLYVTLGSLSIDGVITTDDPGDVRIVAQTSVSQTVNGAVTTDQLGIRAGGFVSLYLATTNDVNDLAVLTTGLVEFRDQDGFTVTTVGVDPSLAFTATTGITSGSNDIYLETNGAGGTLTITEAIAAGTADVRLNVSAETTQTAAITASGLLLTGAGPYTLNLVTNSVTRFAASTSNTINYVNAGNLVIGTVTVTTTSTNLTTLGVTTTGNDVRLKVNAGSFTITDNINLNSGGAGGLGGDLELTATLGATQAGTIFASGLALLGGTAGLANVNSNRYILTNTANDVARIAGSMTNGHVNYVDANTLNVESVTVTTGIIATPTFVTLTTTGIAVGNPVGSTDTGTDGFHSTGGDVILRAGPGTGGYKLTVVAGNDISTKNGTGGDLLIAGGVDTNAALILGSGDIDLAGSTPDICIDTATVITLAPTPPSPPSDSTATLQPIGNILVNEPLSTIGGDLTLNADANNDGDGGVWVRKNGSIDVQGALTVRGSEITATACDGGTPAIQFVGIQVDNTLPAGIEINADLSIVLETKTVAGVSINDDVILDGSVHSRSNGPISIAAENRIFQNGTSAVTLFSSGDIYYQANDIVIDTSSVLPALIDAGAGGIVHLRNRTATQPINVGTIASTALGTAAAVLGLSNDELDRIATVSAVRIGFNSSFTSSPNTPNVLTVAGNAGTIHVTAADIDVLNSNVLHLITGADIIDDGSNGTGGTGTITETELALEAVTGIDLHNVDAVAGVSGNDVDYLSIRLTVGDAVFKDPDDVNFRIVDGVAGATNAVAVTSDLTMIMGGDLTQTNAVSTGGLELIDLFNGAVTNPQSFLASPFYFLPHSSNTIGNLEAYSLNQVNVTNFSTLSVNTVANSYLTFPLAGSSGIWVQRLLLKAPTIITLLPIETNDEIGTVTFDVTTLLDINANIYARSTIEQIGTGAVSIDDVVLRTTDDNISFLGGVTLDGASTTVPTTMSTDAGWANTFTGITLAAAAPAQTGGGSIVFSSTLRSSPSGDTAAAFRGNDIWLETGSGNIQFIGQVGGTGTNPANGAVSGRVGVINIVDTHDVTASTGLSANAFYQQTGDGETRFNGLVQTNGRANFVATTPVAAGNYGVDITTKMITLNAGMTTTQGVAGVSGAIRLNNSGTLSIVAGTGSISSQGAVTQVGTGDNLVGGNIITSNDDITFASDTYLSGTPLQFTAGTANVSFAKRFQINNKTITIREEGTLNVGTVTAIAGGTLNVFVGTSSTKGTVEVGNGELLTGAGTINAAVIVGVNSPTPNPGPGTIAPAQDASGLGTGILLINGNTTFNNTSVLAVDLNGTVAGSSYDQLKVVGTLTLTGSTPIFAGNRPVTFNPALNTTLTVIDATTITNKFANATAVAPSNFLYINGLYFSYVYNGSGDFILKRENAATPVSYIIDDNGSSPSTLPTGFSITPNTTTDWSPNSVAGRGYGNDLRFSAAGTNTATWTFTGLAAGNYRISTTWFPHTNRADNSKFSINGGTPVPLNQRNAPDDFTADGATWEDISTTFNLAVAGSITVQLSAVGATGFVIADAVRVQPLTTSAPEIQVFDYTAPSTFVDVADGTGVIDFGTVDQGAGGGSISKTIRVYNTGTSPLLLSSSSITVPAGFTVTGYSAQSIAAATSATLALNTSFIPLTLTLNTATAANYNGQVSFNTNDFDESPFNFTVKAGVSANTVKIADNLSGGSGYNTITGAANNAGTNRMYGEVGSWHNNDDPLVGYQQDLRYANANANSQATWTFSSLAIGTYRVSVTYRAETNRASNAAFSVAGTGATTMNTTINQRVPPNQFQDTNIYWIDLASTFAISGGSITVTLDAFGSNGFVIADAVRVEYLSAAYPELAAAGPAANPTSTVLNAADLDATAAAAVARWQQAGLTAAQQSALNGIVFTITDLPGAMLGGETEATIFVDANAAGYGWYVDSTPADDAEFGLTIASTELGATDPVAATQMDLLTVLMHEIGHRLGLDDVSLIDNAHGLMAESLNVGIRRLPVVAAVSEGDVDVDDSSDAPDVVTDDVSDQLFYTLGGAGNSSPATPIHAVNGVSGSSHGKSRGAGHSTGETQGAHRHNSQHRTGGKPHAEPAGNRSLLGALLNLVRNRRK